jgi:hypothetical protein
MAFRLGIIVFKKIASLCAFWQRIRGMFGFQEGDFNGLTLALSRAKRRLWRMVRHS